MIYLGFFFYIINYKERCIMKLKDYVEFIHLDKDNQTIAVVPKEHLENYWYVLSDMLSDKFQVNNVVDDIMSEILQELIMHELVEVKLKAVTKCHAVDTYDKELGEEIVFLKLKKKSIDIYLRVFRTYSNYIKKSLEKYDNCLVKVQNKSFSKLNNKMK